MVGIRRHLVVQVAAAAAERRGRHLPRLLPVLDLTTEAAAAQRLEAFDARRPGRTGRYNPPPKPRKNVVKRPPGPMLYVGLTLEKPASVKSWGLMFTKGVHAHISRVTPPSPDGPIVKWCQITESTPHPSIVFRPRGVDTSTTTDEYETNLAKHFPPRPPECEEKRLRWAGLLVPYLNPGDAIICVNGIPVSAFPTTGLFADYIRRK